MPLHVSVPVDERIELVEVTEQNPLISKCQIKVCYLGENRNGSFIDRQTAEKMSVGLRGCPIVGYYAKDTEDFEEHNRMIDLGGNKFEIIDMTKPYGFTDVNAKIWFQDFTDDNQETRTYLMTEGYLWTDIYPESKRIVEKGNNQSMELYEENFDGYWAESPNSDHGFFIITEAIISKLCILGEDYEPCFEGAQIATTFSLQDEFNKLKEMFSAMQEALQEGGSKEQMDQENLDTVVETEAEVLEEAVEEVTAAEEDFACGDKKKKFEAEDEEQQTEEEVTEEVEETEASVDYKLDEIPEYVELQSQYAELEQKFNALTEEKDSINQQLSELQEYKLAKEKEEKMALINSFYMLSEEDKADCVENIDKYSLDEIEGKLSIICVRNKVNFNLDEEVKPTATTFALEGNQVIDDDIPAWIKAVKDTEKGMN